MKPVFLMFGGWIVPHVLFWPVVLVTALMATGEPASPWLELIMLYQLLLFGGGTLAVAVGLFRSSDQWPVRIGGTLLHAAVQAPVALGSFMLSGLVYYWI